MTPSKCVCRTWLKANHLIDKPLLPPVSGSRVIASSLPSYRVTSLHNLTENAHNPPLPANTISNMPPKKAKIDCDLEPYFQYHNRIASFLDWKLDWELNEDKPSPERLARAGFFSFVEPPYQDDNVVCPYCTIALDSWESQDDPMREHKARSPFCDFVLGRQTVRDMGDDSGKTAIDVPSTATREKDETPPAPRPRRTYRKREAGASKASELALAGANGKDEGPPKKRRPGRPRKRAGPG